MVIEPVRPPTDRGNGLPGNRGFCTRTPRDLLIWVLDTGHVQSGGLSLLARPAAPAELRPTAPVVLRAVTATSTQVRPSGLRRLRVILFSSGRVIQDQVTGVPGPVGLFWRFKCAPHPGRPVLIVSRRPAGCIGYIPQVLAVEVPLTLRPAIGASAGGVDAESAGRPRLANANRRSAGGRPSRRRAGAGRPPASVRAAPSGI